METSKTDGPAGDKSLDYQKSALSFYGKVIHAPLSHEEKYLLSQVHILILQKLQWLDTLLSPGKKFKPARTRHEFSIDHAEPLVHFALSSGVYSDPVVRVYTANTISEDLKIAQKEFIQASVCINKENKICLPKILDYFAKDMSLAMPALLEIVYARLPEF